MRLGYLTRVVRIDRGRNDHPYLQQLGGTVGRLVLQAKQAMVPATMTYGLGTCGAGRSSRCVG